MSKNQKKDRKTGKPSHSLKAYGVGAADNIIVKATLHTDFTVSSNVGGNMTMNVSMVGSSANDWGDYSATYDEYRVIGCEIFISSLLQNSITAFNDIGSIAFDNDSSTAPASLAEVEQYNNAMPLPAIFQHPAGKLFRRKWWRPTAGAETTIPWIDVATPAGSLGSIKGYWGALTPSTDYFACLVRFYVEFRGRR